jgi:hypothetical protein
MAKRKTTRDSLSVDISRDMSRIDDFMTSVINDRDKWNEFIRDPNGVCIKANIHPPTSDEVNARTNRVFYATLTNKALIAFVLDHYSKFKPKDAKGAEQSLAKGLSKGRLESHPGLDLQAADHLLAQPDAFRRTLELSLYDLNDRAILNRRYSKQELDDYIDSVAAAVAARRPTKEFPTLEEWDSNYGVGKRFGLGCVEVGPVATVAAAAQAAIAFTVYIAMAAPPSIDQLLRSSYLGDADAARALATLARLFDFAADVSLYVTSFEG